MRRAIVDIETNGFDATVIHCLCYIYEDSDETVALTRYEDMIEFLSQEGLVIVGHKFVTYDKVQLEKVLGIKVKCQIIDSLIVSWYLSFERNKHGLEEYGEDFGVPKVKIADDEWVGPPKDSPEYPAFIQLMCHRCTEDIKINKLTWINQLRYLMLLYENNHVAINNLLKYFEFKLNRVVDQERVGIGFDHLNADKSLQLLYAEREAKLSALREAMPKVKEFAIKEPPAKPYKKDGSLSSTGEKWQMFLDAHDLPPDHNEPVKYLKSMQEPNPNSTDQKKQWLYGLGWVPEHYKFNRDKVTGEIKQVAQIKHKDPDRSDEVCDSIKKLFTVEPTLEILEGLSIIVHRISLLEGFKRDAVNGRLYPSVAGLTNTFRFKHKTIVNLPKVIKKWGKEIRSCLIADEGKVLVGSDLSNIEATTRNHYILPYDPEYVAEMTTPGFDSHTDVAVLAGYITREEEEFFKWFKSFDKEKQIFKYTIPDKFFNTGVKGIALKLTLEELLAAPKSEQYTYIEKIGAIRSKAKTVNFAALYSVGAATLSRNSGLPIAECYKLLETYWKRNWSVKAFVDSCLVKKIGEKMWVYNPISKFFYSLRSEKDIFSTVNQSSAVYVFDLWLSFIVKEGITSCLQMHDEFVANLEPDKVDEVKAAIQRAMDKTNDFLKLNVQIGCSADFGTNYAEIH